MPRIRTFRTLVVLLFILLADEISTGPSQWRADAAVPASLSKTLNHGRPGLLPQSLSTSAYSSRLTKRYIEGYTDDNATAAVMDLLTGPDSGYDPSTRPLFGRGPTKVTAQFQLQNLFDLDPVTSTFTMDLRLRLYWVDERLVAPPGSLPPSNGSDYRVFGSLSLGNGYGPPNAVWTPDIFFVSEVQPQVFDEVIKIVPDTGSVFWSRHFLVQLTNLFNLEQFPFDSQNLLMQLSSYSYNQDQLTLDWYIGGAVFPELTPQTFTQPIWDYVGYTTSKSTYIQHNGGVPYESISLNMVVRRKSTSYYIKTFLPLFLLVALTSVSYWLSIEAVPERLGLTITLVLTIVSFYSSVTQGLPMVNYATNLDWYVFVSFVVAFFSLLEVAAIHHIVRRLSNHILATELDFLCRRYILLFWCLFNVAALVQLPKGSFQWLWLVCGILMVLLLIVNLWLFFYYVWKRYSLRIELEASAYGREHLEDFGEYVSGKFDIGLPGSRKRKMYDYVIHSTDRLFKFLHVSIPGEKIMKEVMVDTDGDGVKEKILVETETERDRIDRRSLDMDLEKARELAAERRVSNAGFTVVDNALAPGERVGMRGRPASVYSVRSTASASRAEQTGPRSLGSSVDEVPSPVSLTVDTVTLPRVPEKMV